MMSFLIKICLDICIEVSTDIYDFLEEKFLYSLLLSTFRGKK